jgi:hypothetical protein
MKWYNIMLFVLLGLGCVLWCASSCSRRTGRGNKVRSSWIGGLIKGYGTYNTPDSSIAIVVSKKANSLLTYVVMDANGSILIDSNDAPSISVLHRWRLYWDSKRECLWVCSSDIGNSLWLKQDGSKFRILHLHENRGFIKIIPEDLFSELGTTYQKLYRDPQYLAAEHGNE